MPFIEVEKSSNSPLRKEISIRKGCKIRLDRSLIKHYLPSMSMSIFIDHDNKLLGLKDVGPIKIREERSHMIAYVACLREYKIIHGRYPVKWSEKHQMMIAEILFIEEGEH